MKAPLPLLLLIFSLALTACASPTAIVPGLLPASQTPPPTVGGSTLAADALRNCVYRSPDWGEFQLTDGVYFRTPPTSQDSPDAYTTRLLDLTLSGDINADGVEDSVVFLNTQNGGSGHLIEMAAVLNLNGSADNISTLALGDRVVVESGAIQAGLITLNLRVHGPNDGLCCPSQKVAWTVRLENGRLVQIP